METCNLKLKLRTISLLAIILVFIFSLTVYTVVNFHKSERVFFFPDHQNSRIVGETRKIPAFFLKKEKNIDIFVNELLLGPINMKLDPLFSSGTKPEKVLYRNKIVYLDLNFKALVPDKKAIHGFDKGVKMLDKNIRFNFPYVSKVVFTISGHELENTSRE